MWIADPINAPETALEHLDGVPWHKAKVHRRWGRHHAQTKGWIGLRYVERCSCGAFGPAPWTRIDPWPKKRPPHEYDGESDA